MKELSFVKKSKKSEISYLSDYAVFDTETSHVDDISWIYVWGFYFNGQYVQRRTPSDFVSLLNYYQRKYDLGRKPISPDSDIFEDKRMIIYVHNLWYDLRHIIRFLFQFGEPEIFAIDSQKVLTCRIDGFEFRDSYLLANRSLENWCNYLDTPHKKKAGTVDYSIVRYQDDKLKRSVSVYQKYDLLSLYDCIKLQMELYDDTITSIPLTSTGYVRRECRNACKRYKGYRKWFNSMRLTYNQYQICHSAFAGGITHANRFIVGTTVKGNIRHFDKKSFYPSTQMLEYFPATKFIHYYHLDSDGVKDISFFNDVLTTKCCIMKIFIEDVKLKSDSITCPYLQFSKVVGAKGKCLQDNGRILSMSGYGIMCVTELDLDILQRQYDFGTIKIIDMYIAERGEFPEPLKECIIDFFKKKEKLPKDSIDYMKSKNHLNAIYGMSVTAIIRDIIVYNFNNGTFEKTQPNEKDGSKQLNEYYDNYNSFMPYQIGIYVTAHCRHELINLIEKIGYYKFLYCDTDSIFWLADETGKDLELINNHNKYQIERNKKQDIHIINRKGELSYFDTFEDEKDNICQFRTLHSKCYAFVDDKDKLHVTIAGVSKVGHDRTTTNATELGVIDNLSDGFTFVECGGTISKYVSYPITYETINGHLTEYADGIIIENSTKKISELYDNLTIYKDGT